MALESEIIVVSGLPRSGTSLMMQMLDRAGIEVVTDRMREADSDNPRGYYEFERVKKIKTDASWLPQLRGKAVKMISQLLYDLPNSERYRIIFMERDFDEMLVSQEKMLSRLGRPAAPRGQIKQSYRLHLKRLHDWLAGQSHMALLPISYNELLQAPQQQAARVTTFLEDRVSADQMVASIDPTLYRNRQSQESA
jgi:hypothetical protein